MLSADKLITVAEAAERFGVTASTINAWLARRRINKYRVQVNGTILVDPEEIARKTTPQLVQPAADNEQQEEPDA